MRICERGKCDENQRACYLKRKLGAKRVAVERSGEQHQCSCSYEYLPYSIAIVVGDLLHERMAGIVGHSISRAIITRHFRFAISTSRSTLSSFAVLFLASCAQTRQLCVMRY